MISGLPYSADEVFVRKLVTVKAEVITVVVNEGMTG